jgi:hypothetical protein
VEGLTYKWAAYSGEAKAARALLIDYLSRKKKFGYFYRSTNPIQNDKMVKSYLYATMRSFRIHGREANHLF